MSLYQSIFTRPHIDREGNSKPIVSMDASHLLNMINLVFRKNIERGLNELEQRAMSGYAPEGMTEKQRRALGLRKMTPTLTSQIQEQKDEAMSSMLNKTMESYWPYLVVGLCRDDTYEGVRALLQDIFDVRGQIDIPSMTIKANMIEGGPIPREFLPMTLPDDVSRYDPEFELGDPLILGDPDDQ